MEHGVGKNPEMKIPYRLQVLPEMLASWMSKRWTGWPPAHSKHSCLTKIRSAESPINRIPTFAGAAARNSKSNRGVSVVRACRQTYAQQL